jgi:peroxiredoxin
MLEVGELAPDFPVGNRTLYSMIEGRSGVVFFFPKAFTAG